MYFSQCVNVCSDKYINQFMVSLKLINNVIYILKNKNLGYFSVYCGGHFKIRLMIIRNDSPL